MNQLGRGQGSLGTSLGAGLSGPGCENPWVSVCLPEHHQCWSERAAFFRELILKMVWLDSFLCDLADYEKRALYTSTDPKAHASRE